MRISARTSLAIVTVSAVVLLTGCNSAKQAPVHAVTASRGPATPNETVIRWMQNHMNEDTYVNVLAHQQVGGDLVAFVSYLTPAGYKRLALIDIGQGGMDSFADKGTGFIYGEMGTATGRVEVGGRVTNPAVQTVVVTFRNGDVRQASAASGYFFLVDKHAGNGKGGSVKRIVGKTADGSVVRH